MPKTKQSKSFGLDPDVIQRIVMTADHEHIKSESELAGQMLRLVLENPRLLEKAVAAAAKKKGSYLEE